MFNSNDFKSKIVDLRKRKGWTQEQLANKLGISPQAVSKWENGIGLPDVMLFPMLSEALGVSTDELFGNGKPDGYEGPEYFNGLAFIASFGNAACYSGKKPDKVENGMAYFLDGSVADLNTQTVVNRGSGEIRIIENEKRSENDVRKNVYKDEELEYFDSVAVKLNYSCSLKIINGDKPSLHIEGESGFVQDTEWDVSQGKINLKQKAQDGKSGNNNLIIITCPFEKGKSIGIVVNGSSVCEIEPDFSCFDVNINGSGEISLQNGEEIDAAINGSGSVSAVSAGERYCGRINGSGFLGVKKAKNADVSINGSGEAELKNVFGMLSAKINGSGAVNAAGDVELMALSVSGSGYFGGGKLACDRADIRVIGQAEIDIDRIRRESVEKISKNSKLCVKNRGLE